MTPRHLDALARSFAAEVSELLNGTVTDGIRLSAVRRPSTGYAFIAPGISPDEPVSAFLALKIGRRPAAGYLRVAFTTDLDNDSRHLTVVKSEFGLYLEPDRRKMLLHYDYVRDPKTPYPPAHVQVRGMSNVLAGWRQRSDVAPRSLERLHLPVGGRRFRPSLEDMVEFLIVEELARPRSGWEAVVEHHRRLWNQRQLHAAVRHDPTTAVAALRDSGHLASRVAGRYADSNGPTTDEMRAEDRADEARRERRR
jgi:hypothetical protein